MGVNVIILEPVVLLVPFGVVNVGNRINQQSFTHMFYVYQGQESQG